MMRNTGTGNYPYYHRTIIIMRNVLTLLTFATVSVFASPIHEKSRVGEDSMISAFDEKGIISEENNNYPKTKLTDYSSQQITKTITGRVLDGQSVPIPGVNITVKGTTTGIVTDVDGYYSISVPENSILVFSFIGFMTQERSIDNRSVINVTLKEDTQQLEEVVVVGYGVQRKSDVVGSISVATSEDILSASSFNALQGLKGKAAGVTVFNNTGNPLGINESGSKVVIRGMNSINTSTEPLYVVDGVQMNEIHFINPNDIERMEILKDASATAIYGARGANGVILVTTKRGQTNKQGVVVSYNGWVSMATLARRMDVMNSEEFMKAEDIAFANLSKYPQGQRFLESQGITEYFVDRSDPLIFDSQGNPLYDTDWQKEATRDAISHSHQLSVQQQNEKSSFGAFFNYTDQQGLFYNNYAKRLNTKFTFDTKPKDWLEINSNIMFNHMWGNGIDDTGGGQTARRTIWELPPILPVKLPDGTYTNSQYEGSKLNFGLEGMANPLDELKNRKRNRYRTKLFGNLALVFHIMDGLDLRTQIGVDANLRQNKDYIPNNLNNISSRGEANFYNAQFIYWQEETYLSYNKLFKDIHRVNATLGASWSKNEESDNSTGTVRDFDSNFYGYDKIQAGKTPENPNSNYSSWTMNSYFARGSYTYRDKYLATATLRVDGSSRFGANSKYGVFPSAGLGWVITNEDFLKDNPWLDNLKLRASYGRTGNTEISVYQTLSTIGTGTNLINGGRAAYNEMTRMPNPDLEWEKTDQFDVGFNLSLFDYRVNIEMDYYIKSTKDLLLAKPLPFTTGFSSVMDNIGEVENKGIDFMLTTTNIETKDFKWESTLNFNYNKNTVKKLGENNEDIILGPDIQGGNTILRVGESLGSFYGYIRYGTWGTHEVEEAAAAGAVPGEAKRSKDKHILGNGMPDFTGSFINKFYYKDFDLTVDLQFVTGVDTWQQYLHTMEDRTGIANGLRTILYKGWTETNQNTMVQQIRQQNYAGQNSMADSHWVCDGSYLRGNLIQLGYTLSNDWVTKWKIYGLRLNLSVTNAFLIKSKDYKAYDPESTTYGDRFGQNIVSFQHPTSRTYTLGVNFSF